MSNKGITNHSLVWSRYKLCRLSRVMCVFLFLLYIPACFAVDLRPMLRISVNTPIPTSEVLVAVTWENIINPSPTDWIGVYLECGDGDDEDSIHEALRTASHDVPIHSTPALSNHTYPDSNILRSPRDNTLLHADPMFYIDFTLNKYASTSGSSIFSIAHTHCPLHFRYYKSTSGPESPLPYTRTRPPHIVDAHFITSSISMRFLSQQLHPRLSITGDYGYYIDYNTNASLSNVPLHILNNPELVQKYGGISRNGKLLSVSSLTVTWNSYTNVGKPIVQWTPIGRLHQNCFDCDSKSTANAQVEEVPVRTLKEMGEIVDLFKQSQVPSSVRKLYHELAENKYNTTNIEFANYISMRKLHQVLKLYKLPMPVPGVPVTVPTPIIFPKLYQKPNVIDEYMSSVDYNAIATRLPPGLTKMRTNHDIFVESQKMQQTLRDKYNISDRFNYYVFSDNLSKTYLPQPRQHATVTTSTSTTTDTKAHQKADNPVMFGSASKSHSLLCNGDASSRNARNYVFPGYSHRANMKGLLPNTVYVFRVGQIHFKDEHLLTSQHLNTMLDNDVANLETNPNVLSAHFSGVYWFVTPADLAHNTNGFQRYISTLYNADGMDPNKYDGYYAFLETSTRLHQSVMHSTSTSTSSQTKTRDVPQKDLLTAHVRSLLDQKSTLKIAMKRMSAVYPPITASAFSKFIFLADGGSPGCYHEHNSCANSHKVARAVAEEIDDLTMLVDTIKLMQSNVYNTSTGMTSRQLNRHDILNHVLIPAIPQSVLFMGDLAYALGSVTGWLRYLHQWGPVMRHIPFNVGVGNHEYDDYHFRTFINIANATGSASAATALSSSSLPSAFTGTSSTSSSTSNTDTTPGFSYMDADADLQRKYLDSSIMRSDVIEVGNNTVANNNHVMHINNDTIPLVLGNITSYVDVSGNTLNIVEESMIRQNERAKRNLTVEYIDIPNSESGGECGVPLYTFFTMAKSYVPLSDSLYYHHNDINKVRPTTSSYVDTRVDRFYQHTLDTRDLDDASVDDLLKLEEQSYAAIKNAHSLDNEEYVKQIQQNYTDYFSSNTKEIPNTLPSNPPFWYSYNQGHVHIIVLSSEHDISPNSTQRLWLLSDLQYTVHKHRIARRKYRFNVENNIPNNAETMHDAHVPFIIVSLHRPLYCSGARKVSGGKTLYLRHELEPIFARYHVDLVFSGHFHSYERTCPMIKGECTSKYISYEDYVTSDINTIQSNQHTNEDIINAMYGQEARLRKHEVYIQPPPLDVNCFQNCDHGVEYGIVHMTAGTAGVELVKVRPNVEPYSHVYDNKSHGYLRLTSLGSYALTVEFVTVDAVYGKVIADSVTIVREWASQNW